MKIVLITFTVLCFVVLAFAADGSTTPKSPSRPDKNDCNAPFKLGACGNPAVTPGKRVYYDQASKECKFTEKGKCAVSPQNQFSTISACKYKCVIDPKNNKATSPKV